MNFDDITLIPSPFCEIESRKDVNPSQKLASSFLGVPIISSPMTSVYSPELAKAAAQAGAISVVHRFASIEENISLFREGILNKDGETIKPWVSVGTSDAELERAEALVSVGADTLVLDVANAASTQAVRQVRRLRELFKLPIIAGNFSTKEQIEAFNERIGKPVEGYRVGVGTGSACATQDTVTGIGLKHVNTILSCVASGMPIIMDGGLKKPADMCKALALGCTAVMMGRPFAACVESGATTVERVNSMVEVKPDLPRVPEFKKFKVYRGSASASSYEEQGKTASHRAPEGREELIEITGPVQGMLQYYEAALRSSMTYLNARDLTEYRNNATWTRV